MANAGEAVHGRGETEQNGPALDRSLGDYVQAHLGRASKFADGMTRDWTVFFFFRILSQAEMEADAQRLRTLMELLRAPERSDAALGDIRAAADVLAAFKPPALTNISLDTQASAGWAGLPRSKPSGLDSARHTPAAAFFRAMLGAAVKGDFHTLHTLWAEAFGPNLPLDDDFRERVPALLALAYDGQPEELIERFARSRADLEIAPEFELQEIIWTVLIAIMFSGLLEIPLFIAECFRNFAPRPAEAGYRALKGGLPGVCLYETLRQLEPAILGDPSAERSDELPPIVRSELREQEFLPRSRSLKWDPCPVNYVFTYAGLAALNIDQTTLASFPDWFREGMAARAERLGDTGPSSPAMWDGLLGVNDEKDLRSVHGYFTGGFLVGDEQRPVEDSLWQMLRDDVAKFNTRSGPGGANLRSVLRLIFHHFGLEVVHIELGENPHDVDPDGFLRRGPYRKEHFGFADGVSQPFVYLGPGILFDPPPGGGTPSPGRSWAPVAPGEVYLSEPDEDGAIQQAPANSDLRKGSTYVVFRKLEQNVPEFRAYLARQRPGDAEAQHKLAAEFVGRWPNGAPLVLAPDRELGFGQRPQDVINNFLYAADDPKGRRCPLGAHARRTNPRDTGGTNEVHRHRILRRSISYGGPLLPPTSIGDGRKRGLLFIALNSRMDLQFELIQSRWINTGEFLGQAGLNRCPLTGGNRGNRDDAFLEAGAVAPVTGLPRFVVTRGGDYFFAPGIDVLKAIANGNTFPPDASLPFDGYSMDDAYTPSLFNPLLDPDRLNEYAYRVLHGTPPVIRIAPPPSVIPGDPAGSPVAFVGQYADVARVLSTVSPTAPLVYSVAPYREAGRRITRGHDLIEGTEPGIGSPTATEHTVLHEVLDAAWTLLNTPPGIVYGEIDALLKGSLDLALRRVATRGSVDLVTDLALASVYVVVDKVFGISGPDWVTELAIALPFYRQHVGELEPGWLDTVKRPVPPIPALATLQTWSIAIVFDVVGNYEQAQELMAVSDQAAGEFLEYLDERIATVRTNILTHPVRYPRPATLVEAFVLNEAKFVGAGCQYPTAEEYYWDVATLLMDLTASAIAFIPNVFGYVMDAVLDFGLNLRDLIPVLSAPPIYGPGSAAEGIPRLVYETCRLNPPAPIVMRACVQNDTLPSGGVVKQGDFVAAMVAAAGMDDRVFTNASTFSLYPFLPGPPRDLNNYLLFGVYNGGRVCWGRDRLALLALTECVKAAGRLRKLRRTAGPGGELRTNLGSKLGIAIGLDARFNGVYRDWP